jgi:protein-S-isoprenylcysteine O-methyltransferase Ste14
MITGIPLAISTGMLIAAFYCMDSVYIRKFDRVREGQGSGRSVSYTLLVVGMASLLVLQPVLFPHLGLVVKVGWILFIQVVGLALVISGSLLHIWARKHLKQFYAERVEIQPNHQLIETGPYAQIRHPVITSFFLFAVGLVLIDLSIPSVLVAAFTLWDFSRAARAEEELLSKTLAGYKDYRARTRAFIPSLSKYFKGRKHAG